jgi:hypothetical protein
MDAAIELLENYGLIRDEDSLRVEEFSKTKIVRLHRQLHSAILDNQAKDFEAENGSGEIDPFSFVASKSLRGGADCGEYFCRMQKVDVLGRYAALYANRVILPLPLQDPSKVDSETDAARQVSHASFALLRLRPLIDAGLVFPVVMRSFHRCEHALEWTNRMIEFIHWVARDAAKDFQRDFRVTFQLPEKSPTGLPSVYIEGPEDFLEHGTLVLWFDENKKWRSKNWRYNREGKVELRGPRKMRFLDEVFRSIADDTTFYLAYGRNRNARYLASRAGETFLLDLLTTQDEELAASSAALNAYMTHSLPLLNDLPLATLVRIRRQERDSFARYRLAIGRILTAVVEKKTRIGKQEVRDLFREQIEPELAKMRSELNQERKRQARRTVFGIGAMAASVALGAFGHIVPAVAAGSVGTGLLTEAAKSTCSHGANLKEKNDFYFLLRLTQEAEAGR